ncbi:uncharacterized protein FOMMEDRAFT_165518 [Fomitiporia mediterranea MF3/22]|uniref:uncharacterized protein n=1 Tax=Fomitiporia mediterranea (strain MF3/22) TaxID=694068 RepID=UPI00044098A7|nr:uncharacterized protein FOMMEDRAFT_165518 [Fomitiporia mediterranea MF3/22]EJD06830.1 hypothetical protein FOMMEDRAFT_165518 [Fomitiporia mediterranea MF3/22]
MSPTYRITLYDVETNLEGKSLSPYSVTIRLLLNYKKIPYENVWLGFRDIEATAKAVGASPTKVNADGNPGYTIPFITVTNNDKQTTAISDSIKIAQYIEEAFPDPEHKLFPAETRVFQSVFSTYLTDKTRGAYSVVFLRLVNLLLDNDREWFIESRRRIGGRSVEEMVPQDEASMQIAWKNFDAVFDELAAHLDKAGEGNYRITGGVSYSEFELVSFLNLIYRLSFDEAWKRLKGRNGGRWEKLLNLPVYKDILPVNRVGSKH